MSRNAERAHFLAMSGWALTDVQTLAGDASLRSYFRLHDPKRTAVLMDVANDPTDSIQRFLTVGAHLQDIGLHPPTVLSVDRAAGFIILEDLGDDLFARVMARDAASEMPLYQAAIDVLSVVQQAPAPDLPLFDSAVMAKISGLAASAYAGRSQETDALTGALRPLLDRITVGTSVMVMRDFHAENLVWCPKESGPRRVGLLDFQDAVLGHPVYDVVSLLQDARRDVAPDVEAHLKKHVRSLPHWSGTGFDFAYAVLGAQRALRILGVFARLSLEHGKPGYVDLIPRVWRLLDRNLAHPDLADLASTIKRVLPAPDPPHLNDLKSRCQIHQTP